MPAPQIITLAQSGVGTLVTPTITATSDPSAIIASAVITGSGPWSLTVTPRSLSGVVAGTYNATLTVESANQTNPPVIIAVQLVVLAAPPVVPLTHSVSPSSVPVSVVQGSNATPSNVAILAAGDGVLITPVAGTPTNPFVSGVVIAGSHPNWTAAISFNTSALAAGSYSSTIAITSPNSTSNPQNVTVNLTVAAASVSVVVAPRPILPFDENGIGIGWDLTNDRPLNKMFDYWTIPTVTGAVHLVPGSKTFSQALLDAVSGDEIRVAAGHVATGNFQTTKTNAGRILIRTANFASLSAAGTRVAAAEASNMFTIRSVGINDKALIAMAASKGYYFFGAIFTNESGVSNQDAIISMLPVHGGWNTKAAAPTDYVLNKCWIKGQTAGQRRGWAPAGKKMAAVDCRFSNLWDDQNSDAQAVGTWEWTKHLILDNCYLDGSGEPVLLGGATPTQLDGSYADTSPQDVVITRCEITWTGPDTRLGKCLFESKNSERVVINACVLHDMTARPGSHEYVFNIGSQNQGSIPALQNYTMARNYTIRSNLIKNCRGRVFGFHGNNGTLSSEVAHDCEASYNYAWSPLLGGPSYTNGLAANNVRTCYEITTRFNTIVGYTYLGIYFDGLGPAPPGGAFGQRIYNNALAYNASYGWLFGNTGRAVGTGSWTPNELWGVGKWQTSHNAGINAINQYVPIQPGGNPDNTGTHVQLANLAAFGFTNPGANDYSLAGGSPLIGAGYLGANIGGHWATFQANIAGVETG